MKRASFRRRLFGAMLLVSLIPLLICTALMVQKALWEQRLQLQHLNNRSKTERDF